MSAAGCMEARGTEPESVGTVQQAVSIVGTTTVSGTSPSPTSTCVTTWPEGSPLAMWFGTSPIYLTTDFDFGHFNYTKTNWNSWQAAESTIPLDTTFASAWDGTDSGSGYITTNIYFSGLAASGTHFCAAVGVSTAADMGSGSFTHSAYCLQSDTVTDQPKIALGYNFDTSTYSFWEVQPDLKIRIAPDCDVGMPPGCCVNDGSSCTSTCTKTATEACPIEHEISVAYTPVPATPILPLT